MFTKERRYIDAKTIYWTYRVNIDLWREIEESHVKKIVWPYLQKNILAMKELDRGKMEEVILREKLLVSVHDIRKEIESIENEINTL